MESSGRPELFPYELNFANHLLLSDAEYDFSQGDRNSLHPSRNNIVPSEQSSQMDGSQKALELGDSCAFGIPRKSYKRRYRSRSNRDGPRLSSTDVNSIHGSNASLLPSRQGPKDANGLVPDPEGKNTPSNFNSKQTCPLNYPCHNTIYAALQLDMKSDNVKVVGSTTDLTDIAPQDTGSDTIASRNPQDDLPSQQLVPGGGNTSYQLNSNGPEAIQTMEDMASAADSKAAKRAKPCQVNGFRSKDDGMPSSVDNNSASCGIKGSDFDIQASRIIDGNDNGMCTKMGTVESKKDKKEAEFTNQNLVPDNSQGIEGCEFIKDKKEAEFTSATPISERMRADCHQVQNGSKLNPDEESDHSGSLKNCMKVHNTTEGIEARGPTGSESDRMHTDLFGQNSAPCNETCNGVSHQDYTDPKSLELPGAGSLTRISTVSTETEISKSESKVTDIVDEDSILEEAEIIEVIILHLCFLCFISVLKELSYVLYYWDIDLNVLLLIGKAEEACAVVHDDISY